MNLNIKIKALGCLISLISISHLCLAQVPMGNVMGRTKQSLNGKWQVITDWYDRGTGSGIFNDDTIPNKNVFREYRFDAATLNVPADWNSQLADLKYYEGSMWYKKTSTSI